MRGHVTHMNETCHTCRWDMSHIWMSHVTHMNETCHTCGWSMCEWGHDSVIYVTWLIQKCDMTYSYIWRDSCTQRCEAIIALRHLDWGKITPHIWMRHVAHVNAECGSGDMTYSYVWHDYLYMWHESFIKRREAIIAQRHFDSGEVTSHIWMRHVAHVNGACGSGDMTHSYVWHDSYICMTWLIHKCDMTRTRKWHDLFACVTRLIHMCDVTHSYRRAK